MTHRGLAEELGLHLRDHGREVALAAIELAEGIADMDRLDVVGLEQARRQGAVDRLAHHVGVIESFARPDACEIGLITADQVDRHDVPLAAIGSG